jgi:hypothetical protein
MADPTCSGLDVVGVLLIRADLSDIYKLSLRRNLSFAKSWPWC